MVGAKLAYASDGSRSSTHARSSFRRGNALVGLAAVGAVFVCASGAVAQTCATPLRTLDISSNPPGASSTANSLAAIGNRAAIQANSTARGFVWDGLPGGSGPLLASLTFQLSSPVWFLGTHSGKFYFTASTRLYVCDLDGTNITPLVGESAGGQLPITVDPSESLQLTPVGDQSRFVFAGVQSTTGRELAISNGTNAGTSIVIDINPGTASSFPFRFVPFAGKSFFFAQTVANGVEPWITDGTAGGTRMLADISAGSRNSAAYNPDQSSNGTTAVVGSTLYFLASINGTLAIFRTDGTPSGTSQVDLGGVTPRGYLAAVPGGILFVGGTSTLGDDLYFTNGAASGTTRVSGITPGPTSTAFFFVRSSGDHAFVCASNNGGTLKTLYAFNGLTGTLAALPSVLSGGVGATSMKPGPFVRGGKFLYASIASPNSRLVLTDGTPAGTCALPGQFTTFFTLVDGQGLVNAATPSRAFVMGLDTQFGNEPRAINLCPADFNNSGGDPNAQDVYDYLAAFFGGSAAADFNGSGGAATVQDVLDFIEAWFTGCA